MSRWARRRRQNDEVPPSAYHPPRSLTPLLRETPSPATYRLIDDRRTYHPLEFFRPAKLTSGHPVGPVTVKTPRNKSKPFIAHQLGFSLPKQTLICIRRKQRKEVLHALKKTGRGKGGGRKRRNWFSNIGC